MSDGEEGQFQAGGDAGFVEDVGEVALDGFFAEVELLGDVAVAASLDDGADDFKLAGGEAVGLALRDLGLLHEVVEGGDEVDDALAADPVIAAEDGADGGLQVVGEGVFEDDAAGADVQGLDDLLGGDGGGEEQNLDRGHAVHDGAHGFKAGQARHLHVEEQDIGLQFEGLSDGFVAVGGIADDFKAIRCGEHVAYTDADHGMVVRHHNSNRSFHLRGLPPKAGSCLRRKFNLQHTLQAGCGGAQIVEESGTVIQMVTCGLEGCAEAGGLEDPGHAASALDGVAYAADFGDVFIGDGDLQDGDSAGQIGDDGSVNLSHRGFRHHLAKPGQDFRIDDRGGRPPRRRSGRRGTLQGRGIAGDAGLILLRGGGRGLGLALFQLAQVFRSKRLEQESVGGGDNLGRRVAAADGIEPGPAAGAKLLNQLGTAQARHLRVHEDDAGDARAGGERLERRRAAVRGVDGIAAHGEDGGRHLAADGVVVNEQDRGKIPLATEIEHGYSVPLPGGIGLRIDGESGRYAGRVSGR